jgi:hypothetical protein
LGTPAQGKLIRDPFRRQAIFSFPESSANPGFSGLATASPASPDTRCNDFAPFVS